jgi:ligand-binding SRPBCC domain-containing protein
MRLFKLETTQRLPIGLEEAWSFFSNPNNLARITPRSLGFQVTSDVPERMYPGLIITYRITPLLGVAMTWVTEITHVQEPVYFVDEQRFGPYRFWHHQHHFREVAGGTEVRDVVHFALPRGTALAAGWLVRRRVEAIFSFRGAVLHDTFGTLPEDRA